MYDVNELSESEKKLLANFAVLPPENIPLVHLEKLLASETLDERLIALANKGWIEYNEAQQAFKCSPVIQEICRNKESDHLYQHCEALIQSLNEQLKYDEGGNLKTIDHNTAFEYCQYGKNIGMSFSNAHEGIVRLYSYMGTYYETTGDLDQSFYFYEQSHQILITLAASAPNNVSFKTAWPFHISNWVWPMKQVGMWGKPDIILKWPKPYGKN